MEKAWKEMEKAAADLERALAACDMAREHMLNRDASCAETDKLQDDNQAKAKQWLAEVEKQSDDFASKVKSGELGVTPGETQRLLDGLRANFQAQAKPALAEDKTGLEGEQREVEARRQREERGPPAWQPPTEALSNAWKALGGNERDYEKALVEKLCALMMEEEEAARLDAPLVLVPPPTTNRPALREPALRAGRRNFLIVAFLILLSAAALIQKPAPAGEARLAAEVAAAAETARPAWRLGLPRLRQLRQTAKAIAAEEARLAAEVAAGAEAEVARLAAGAAVAAAAEAKAIAAEEARLAAEVAAGAKAETARLAAAAKAAKAARAAAAAEAKAIAAEEARL
eukprot:scaffold45422_cov73-Phaeocystis_antarctica.AAC.1